MKLLVLYSELAGYFYSCLEELVDQYDIEITIIVWPINDQAPFKFVTSPKISVIQKANFEDNNSMHEFCLDLNPSIVYVSGWIDRSYLEIASDLRRTGKPVIMALDTQWESTLRQWIALVISPFYFRRIFSHVWVAGLYQYEYARRLSFRRNEILSGVYSCNQKLFYEAYLKSVDKKKLSYPKTFLYVGRFSHEKGATDLYNVFNSLSDSQRNGWNLLFVGTGPLKNEIVPNAITRVMDFMQPEELPSLVAESGCYILPSNKEPWGVTVHEFSAAGLPLIVSDVVGSGTAFVRNGFNGYVFKNCDPNCLKNAILKVIGKSDDELLEMGDRSASLSFQITPATWATTLMTINNERN